MQITFKINNIAELNVLARCISKVILPKDLLLLSGNLGTGKTAFTKAFAANFGIDEGDVTSPSFTLINEYREGKVSIIHSDLYRLGPGVDISEIGLDEYLMEGCIVLVEWAEYIKDDFKEALWVKFEWIDENKRIIHLESSDPGWEKRLREVDACFHKGDKHSNRHVH